MYRRIDLSVQTTLSAFTVKNCHDSHTPPHTQTYNIRNGIFAIGNHGLQLHLHFLHQKKNGALSNPAQPNFAQASNNIFLFWFSLYIINGYSYGFHSENECIVKVFVEWQTKNLKWCHKISFIRTGLCEHKETTKAHFTMCKFQFEWIRFVSLWFVVKFFFV